MDPYSHLLERIRVPQPSIQRFAVISIFEKLKSNGPESDAAKGAISHCLRSSSSAVIDQSVRELCRIAKEGKIRVSHALLELQAALEGGEDSRFIDIFVKGIGFLCQLGFQKNTSWQFESAEAHPFVKVLSIQTEAQGELLHQTLLFIVQNKTIGFTRTLKFLQPFLTFSVLKIPYSVSSSAFARQLISSLATLSCSFPSEAVPIIKVALGCLKFFPHRNVEEFKHLVYCFEHLVDAFVVIFKQLVSTGLPANELQVCSVELLDTVLSLCTDLQKRCTRNGQIIELSKRLLFVQKELGLQYIPDFISVVASLFIILIQAEFEHEQLSILKLSLFLLKWKNENGQQMLDFPSILQYVIGRASCSFNEELVFVFPIINLLASPSKSVKAAAIDFLSLLERLFATISAAPKKVTTTPVGFSSTSRPEYIIFRLIHHLWSQDHSSLSNLYFLKFACTGKPESEGMFGETKSWISELREFSLVTAVRQKSPPNLQSLENLFTGMPLLLCALVATLVMHPTMGRSAVDSLAALGIMDPKVGVPLLLSILFYNKLSCSGGCKSPVLLPKLLGMLPSLASHSVMVPLIVQTILPMLHKDTRHVDHWKRLTSYSATLLKLGPRTVMVGQLGLLGIGRLVQNGPNEPLDGLYKGSKHNFVQCLVWASREICEIYRLRRLTRELDDGLILTRLLYATAVRLLCKTWEVTDRVFGNLLGILQPAAFSEFASERNICISIAASLRDVCKGNPDRGVDLILSVSACIESRDPIVQALGFEGLGHLCEADVVDFYTAWDVIADHVLDYSTQPTVARGLCILLRWGALDAEAYPDVSKRVVQILWEIGNFRHTGEKWINARTTAFVSLIHYEVELVRESIPNFNKRNMELLCSEDNLKVLRSIESLQAKILTYEHITRRRLLKERRVTANKVEKLLDVFPQVMFSSGKDNVARELPGASLLSLAFKPKDTRGQCSSKEFVKLNAAYERALKEIAESLQLSRNILVALFSLQSWKPFMQRWMKASILSIDAKITPNESHKASKASDDILKTICRIAEESIPRSAENIALAIGALCGALPPSAHAVTSTASKFLLKWLFQYEHEHRQWSAAISLGVVSSCLHATESQLKFQIITGLLEVSSNSKSTLVKGACGLGMGFACQDLLTKGVVGDSDMEEGTIGFTEAALLGNIVKAFSTMISQLCPSSFLSMQSLCEKLSFCTGVQETVDLSGDNLDKKEEDIWGVAALVLGLAHSVTAIYRAGAHDAVLMIKDMLLSWIPHVNSFVHNLSVCNEKTEIALSVGSCLALPIVVAFCQRAELMGNEVDNLVNGYKSLISELVKLKKSGILHQSFLMASCIGSGNLLSCILNEGVHPVKADDIKGLLELMRNTYCQPYPPTVNLGGMLGIVNSLGAGVGTLSHTYNQSSSLQMDCAPKESCYIRGPILSSAVCEPLCTSLIREMFVIAQDSKNQQIQKYAAWAVSFLRHQWWSKDFQSADVSKSNPEEPNSVSQNISEDSTAWKLCIWLMDLNYLEMKTVTHVNTVAAVLRCLSHAPRIPSLEWGAIIRRCMKYEDQISNKLNTDVTIQKGMLREECIRFSLAHANQVTPLLLFVDELSDLSRFRMLELKLQSCLLSHFADLMKIFSGSRVEKLFSDMIDHFFTSASSFQSYNPEQKSLLRISFWKGLCQSLDKASTEFTEYMANMEKCMEELFLVLPASLYVNDQGVEQAISKNEWCEVVRCLGKAPKDWLMDFLQLPEMGSVGGSHLIESIKRIAARARLVMTGCLPVTELGKTEHYILNAESEGIWSVLIEVVAALQHTEGNIKRQWLLDAVEISCITKYPSTALQFVGLLSGSCCKYMPLLIVDRVTVLNDLPVTLPSLLSDSSWNSIAESLVQNLWASTERIYAWAMQLANNDSSLGPESIDSSESCRSGLLARVMLNTCVSLKDYLSFEKQSRLANMVIA